MKFKRIFILNLIVILLFASCSPQAETENSDALGELIENNEESSAGYKDGFIFIYKDTPVYIGDYAENILEKFEPLDSYEYQSCTFEGMATRYYYDDFEFSTYVNNKSEKNRIYSIDLFETVSTSEGIAIGQTYENMLAVYGTEYEEIQGSARIYRYLKGGVILTFHVEDDIIILISYQVEDLYN